MKKFSNFENNDIGDRAPVVNNHINRFANNNSNNNDNDDDIFF